MPRLLARPPGPPLQFLRERPLTVQEGPAGVLPMPQGHDDPPPAPAVNGHILGVRGVRPMA